MIPLHAVDDLGAFPPPQEASPALLEFMINPSSLFEAAPGSDSCLGEYGQAIDDTLIIYWVI